MDQKRLSLKAKENEKEFIYQSHDLMDETGQAKMFGETLRTSLGGKGKKDSSSSKESSKEKGNGSIRRLTFE